MIFIDQPDFKTRIILERILEGSITKKEMRYLNYLVRGHQELNEARFLEPGKYLHIKRFRAKIIEINQNGESKVVKVLGTLGNVRLQFQTEMFIRLSSGGKGLKESKQKPKSVNRFLSLQEKLKPSGFWEQILSKVVS